MSDVGRASVQRLLRLLATIGAALIVVVIVSSAYLRHAEAGLSCADWPSCYGHITQAGGATTAQRSARLAHRLSASAASVMLLALLAVAAAQRPVGETGTDRRRGTSGCCAARHHRRTIVRARARDAIACGDARQPRWRLCAPRVAGLAAADVMRRDHRRAGFGTHALTAARIEASCRRRARRGDRQVALGALVSAKFAALACRHSRCAAQRLRCRI